MEEEGGGGGRVHLAYGDYCITKAAEVDLSGAETGSDSVVPYT